ncbi:hypothetical protein ACFL6C_01685 [Myxococcota bacterium]
MGWSTCLGSLLSLVLVVTGCGDSACEQATAFDVKCSPSLNAEAGGTCEWVNKAKAEKKLLQVCEEAYDTTSDNLKNLYDQYADCVADLKSCETGDDLQACTDKLVDIGVKIDAGDPDVETTGQCIGG